MKRFIIISCLVAFCATGFTAAFAAENSVEAAKAALAEQRFEDAKAIATALLAENSESAENHFLLAKAQGGLGDWKGAVESYKKTVKLDNTVAEYYAEYGSALINKGQGMNMFQAGPVFMSSLDQYKKAIALDPDNLQSHIGLCRYYWNAPPIAGGSMKKAKEHAAEVARINPYLGHIEHALIAKKEQRSEDAITEFEAIVAQNPNETWVHYELGMLYQATGEVEKAKAAYQKVLALDPGHEGATAALAGME